MAISLSKPLGGVASSGSPLTYEAPVGHSVIITAAYATNRGSSTSQLYVALIGADDTVPSDLTADKSFNFIDALDIAVGETFEWGAGITLGPGDTLAIQAADAAAINIVVFGEIIV